MSIVGMTSFAGIAGSVGVLEGIQSALGAFCAANQAASMAIMPPGSESASALAMAQQQAGSATYAANFLAGIEQMMELNGAILASSAATEITDAGNAVMSLI
ncbi:MULTISPECIES: hypothetical protein [Mycolicibacter]|uniref:PE family protein n=2 Tax=Mycolicibacter TaxID=1073531 RepID=A0ABU5XL23_9MYCO|nr:MULTISPECIES: hypothetical protein [unclassified Mycolicibacter]MEB3022957.1 hypothetical protein [Mycolicibacter sp. MYC098]MEB3033467.1 hypothetical protein [Mycolicibacter sp. MYC340]